MSFKYPNIINTAQTVILRGTDQQTDIALLYVPPSMKLGGQGSATVATPAPTDSRSGIEIGRFELHNGAAANNLGIGFRFANAVWEAGHGDATNGYEVNANLKTTTAVTGIGAVTLDSLQIWSRYKFNWVSANFSTALTDDTGGTDSTDVAFTDSATPTAFIDHFTTGSPAGMLQIAEAVTTSIYLTTDAAGTGEAVMCFNPPEWWGKSNVTLDTAGPLDMYGIDIEWTSGNTITAGAISGLEIGWMVYNENVASDGGIWEQENVGLSHVAADSVVAFFEIIDDGNRVYAECRPYQ